MLPRAVEVRLDALGEHLGAAGGLDGEPAEVHRVLGLGQPGADGAARQQVVAVVVARVGEHGQRPALAGAARPARRSAKSCASGSSPEAKDASSRPPPARYASSVSRSAGPTGMSSGSTSDGVAAEVAARVHDVELVAELLEHAGDAPDGR